VKRCSHLIGALPFILIIFQIKIADEAIINMFLDVMSMFLAVVDKDLAESNVDANVSVQYIRVWAFRSAYS
jgi:hypothetical protein